MSKRRRRGVLGRIRFERIGVRIVDLVMERPKRRLVRSPHSWVIGVLLAGLGVLYYAEQLGLCGEAPAGCFFATVHDLHRTLFFVPIIYSSLVFRLRGGLLACLAFLAVVLPRALLFSEFPHPVARAMAFVGVATLVSSLLAVLLGQMEKVRAARAQLADLHDELAESLVRLQESEEQLVQAEKMSLLGQMAASIAHEINNPLAGVLVYTKLLAKKLAEGALPRETGLDYLTKMGAEIDRSSRIIRNLLDFARPSALAPSDVDVNQVIEDAVDLVGHRASLGQIELVRDLLSDLPKVYADYDQLRQVFVNLVLNAIQATEAGGRVILRTRIDDRDGALRLEVEDTGCGISEENRKMLFTPFFTTKEKGEGVGLGLAVARGIVERHAGDVEVESEEGVGTTFIVRLPAQAPVESGG